MNNPFYALLSFALFDLSALVHFLHSQYLPLMTVTHINISENIFTHPSVVTTPPPPNVLVSKNNHKEAQWGFLTEPARDAWQDQKHWQRPQFQQLAMPISFLHPLLECCITQVPLSSTESAAVSSQVNAIVLLLL